MRRGEAHHPRLTPLIAYFSCTDRISSVVRPPVCPSRTGSDARTEGRASAETIL